MIELRSKIYIGIHVRLEFSGRSSENTQNFMKNGPMRVAQMGLVVSLRNFANRPKNDLHCI